MPQSAAKRFSGIFVSYRREDTAGYARQLKELLRKRFGKDQVFWAEDSIGAGREFEQVIKDKLDSCQVLLALIGRHWLSSAAEWSRQDDYVRLEIATALSRKIPVIPVLVQRTDMPRADDLPDDLKPLVTLEFRELGERHWESDVKRLIDELDNMVVRQGIHQMLRRLAALIAVICLALLILASVAVWRARNPPVYQTVQAEPPLAVIRVQPFRNEIGMEFVWVPPGSFMMGSLNREVNEQPVHQVTFNNGFYMGKYEVTQEQWQKLIHHNPSKFKGDKLPVETVTWAEASDFIMLLNGLNDGHVYRLPTEAEWENAARAGTTGDYAGDLNSMAWYGFRDANEQTHPVGQKKANAFGLYDMSGNVGEWCQDVYHYTYDNAPGDGSAWLSGDQRVYRVVRGGSWYYGANYARSAHRDFSDPGKPDQGIGFRVVAVAWK